MEVIWSSLAEQQLNEELDYLVENVSVKVAQNLLETLILSVDRLALFPCLGLLVEENPLYRVLIENNYKIVYSVEEEYVRIAFLFNTKQDPVKLKSFLKPQ